MENIKPILTRYKSHLVTALIVAIIFYALGHTIAFNENLSWVYFNRTNTEKFVLNSKTASNIQRDLYSNLIDAYDQVVECLRFNKQTCDPEVVGKKLNDLAKEKEQMIIELNKTYFETEKLIKEMGY